MLIRTVFRKDSIMNKHACVLVTMLRARVPISVKNDGLAKCWQVSVMFG